MLSRHLKEPVSARRTIQLVLVQVLEHRVTWVSILHNALHNWLVDYQGLLCFDSRAWSKRVLRFPYLEWIQVTTVCGLTVVDAVALAIHILCLIRIDAFDVCPLCITIGLLQALFMPDELIKHFSTICT